MQAKQAAIKQVEAQLRNADLTLSRARELLRTTAGTQADVDAAEASQQALAAQLLAAQAQLRQSRDQPGLYGNPRADRRQDRPHRDDRGQCCRSELRRAVDDRQPRPDVRGLFRSLENGARTETEDRRGRRLRRGQDRRQAAGRPPLRPGRQARLHQQHRVDGNRHAAAARRHRQPVDSRSRSAAAGPNRELLDGEFVNVLLEGAQPIEALVVPREAVLTDQSGDYVYVVDAQGKAQRQGVKLGQSTPTSAAI